MFLFSNLQRFLTISIVVLISVGCNNGPTVPASGMVTLDGNPLPRVIVNFTPINGERAGNANTDDQGRFANVSTFKANDGVVPGDHQITIIPVDPPPMPGGDSSPGSDPRGGGAAKYVPPFPEKYGNAETSGLTATVERGADNQFTFELSSK